MWQIYPGGISIHYTCSSCGHEERGEYAAVLTRCPRCGSKSSSIRLPLVFPLEHEAVKPMPYTDRRMREIFGGDLV